jgi:hypothetical protein
MASNGDNRRGHSLIALIALRQAKAIEERKAREAAAKTNGDAPKPGKRGWFG